MEINYGYAFKITAHPDYNLEHNCMIGKGCNNSIPDVGFISNFE